MTQEMIWVHPDCLSAANPAFLKYPEAPAVFVFDEGEIETEQWSLKRIGFLYECLLEMPVEISRGDVVTELAAAVKRVKARSIVTVDSVNPRFQEQRRLLDAVVEVKVLPPVAFVEYRGPLDLKRFSRYWKRVEPILFGE